MTCIAAALRRAETDFAGLPALTLQGRTANFAELAEAAWRAAGALEALRLVPGEPLAVEVAPTFECVAVLLGALVAGVPVLAVDDASALAADPPRISVRPGGLVRAEPGPSPAGVVSIDARRLLAEASAPPCYADRGEARPDGLLMQLTSGTVGARKAAVHPAAHLVAGAEIYCSLFGVRPGDLVVATVPLAHSFGMVGGIGVSLHAGARLVHAPATPPRRFVEALAAFAPRMVLTAPLVYDLCARCVLDEVPDLGAVDTVFLSSGTALPPEVAAAFAARFGARVVSVYGCTEMGIIAAGTPREGELPESVGRLVPGAEARVKDAEGRLLPTGARGELWVRTGTCFREYLGEPGATAAVLLDGWYRTGDTASLAADGHLWLHGRKAAFVNVAGRKVNPAEVADVLRGHPAVREARSYGREAGAAGEHLVAEVELLAPVPVSALAAWCRERLPPYECPVEFLVVPHVPSPGEKLAPY